MPDKFGDKIRLQHALDAIDKIQRYLKGIKKADFLADDMTQDACIRQLQVIGESVNRIQSRTQKANPNIPWAKIIGLRNVVVHEYFGINGKIIWSIIKKDLPLIKDQFKELIVQLPD